MTPPEKYELLAKLHELEADHFRTMEEKHLEADRLLLEYIDDPEITEAFGVIEKGYD